MSRRSGTGRVPGTGWRPGATSRLPAAARRSAAALAATALLLLAGCAADAAPGDLVYGDLVVDARGEYLPSRLGPESPALVLDADRYADAAGVLDAATAGSGLAWLVQWIAEQAIDGAALESAPGDAAWLAWRERALAEWLDPVHGEDLLMHAPYQDRVGRPPLLVTGDPLGLELRLARDGGPRFSAGRIVIDPVVAGAYQDGTPFLRISGRADYTARVDDAALAAQLVADGQAADAAAAIEAHPALGDGEPEPVALVFRFGYRIADLGDGWRITGIEPGAELGYRWLG